MEIKIVFDKEAVNKNLHIGWGLSILIDKKILFDTGERGDWLIKNMKFMGINPDDIEVIVISHDHWDHTGGLEAILKAKKSKTPVYVCKDFSEELKEMIKIKGEFRVRLSSIMPDEFDYEILEFMKDGKLAPHLHISIQSGSDYIIKLMRRGYTSSSLIELAEKARKIRDDVGLTGDVIVGFPGETDEHFRQTLETVSKMGFFRLHVFPFSPRKGTPAATMPNQVTENVKKEREKILLDLTNKLSLEFKKKFLNKYLRFIPEETKEGKTFGYADNYLRIISNNPNLKHNQFELAKVIDLNPKDMTSVIAE